MESKLSNELNDNNTIDRHSCSPPSYKYFYAKLHCLDEKDVNENGTDFRTFVYQCEGYEKKFRSYYFVIPSK